MSAQNLPSNLLSLFVARPPLPFLPPLEKRRKKPLYTGVTDYIDLFESCSPPPKEPFENPIEKKARKREEALEAHRRKLAVLIESYDPHHQPSATKNPFATLFVGRLSYDTTEKTLRKEFEHFGKIRKIKTISDLSGKSRGYAFIEYEREEDLIKAYKYGEGIKIDGRRLAVDVERARTVPNWLPRRLGGGKGPARFVESKKKGGRLSSSSSTASAASSAVSAGSHHAASSSSLDSSSSSSSSLMDYRGRSSTSGGSRRETSGSSSSYHRSSNGSSSSSTGYSDSRNGYGYDDHSHSHSSHSSHRGLNPSSSSSGDHRSNRSRSPREKRSGYYEGDYQQQQQQYHNYHHSSSSRRDDRRH